jgi:hypothetical protein
MKILIEVLYIPYRDDEMTDEELKIRFEQFTFMNKHNLVNVLNKSFNIEQSVFIK